MKNTINNHDFSEAGDTGLSTLLILQQLMETMTFELQCDVGIEVDLHPSDVFDLIGGSGTGGIAAILIGRLGLSVSEAIDVYKNELAPLLFGPFPTSKDEKQAATLALEATMQKIVAEFGGSGDLRLREPTSPRRSCKTFVLALTPHYLNDPVDLLRTYHARIPSLDMMIWQAMRATTSNRNRFLDVEINYSHCGVPYVGADYGRCNPIKVLLDEAHHLFRGPKIASVTCVGAGHGGIIALPSGSDDNPSEIMFRMARDCERDAMEISNRFDEGEKNEPGYNPYARLSVEQGMQTAGGLDYLVIERHTEAYLAFPFISKRIEAIVGRLTKPR
ncbi:hypothetical protein DL96DRAFT_1485475 [Flagelloscypha sp. PMI_526]|nr:hypothetical protein DL96DRAFT_1485475 [Flagelloscypha sp. PMI_526]